MIRSGFGETYAVYNDGFTMPIEHISDTARWVATYRAWETKRPDALFHDPYAGRLAGERGEEIVRNLKRGKEFAWAMIVRTAVMDEIVLKQVAQGADTVVNLAAGLDARPYRLQIPSTLRWIEVDLPDILKYKEEALKNDKPVCRLDRIYMDLSNLEERRKLFREINDQSKKVLVITEGLLIYLTAEQVGALASDLHDQPRFEHWLCDISSPGLLKMLNRTHSSWLKASGIRMQFAPEGGPDYFRSQTIPARFDRGR